jgi:hypothetical protein
MEIIKFHSNHTFGSSYPKAIKTKIDKDIFGKIGDCSLKSRKNQSQSLSTNCEDRKENEIKTVISMKNIILKPIKANKNNINFNVNNINILGNKNFENRGTNKNKISSNGIKNINIKDIKNCNYFVNNKSEKKIEKGNILRSLPPAVPELFNNMYILSNKNKNYGNSNNSSIKINKVPNCFYKHLMIKHNNNRTYLCCSITERIKAKLLTIIFYQPVKT